jgi:septin family protein
MYDSVSDPFTITCSGRSDTAAGSPGRVRRPPWGPLEEEPNDSRPRYRLLKEHLTFK